jgi:hypothetical protein
MVVGENYCLEGGEGRKEGRYMGCNEMTWEVHAEIKMREVRHPRHHILKKQYFHNNPLSIVISRITIKRYPGHKILNPLMHKHDTHAEVIHIRWGPVEGIEVG